MTNFNPGPLQLKCSTFQNCSCIAYSKLATGETRHGRAACNAEQLLKCPGVRAVHNATRIACPKLCENTLLTVTANQAQ